MQDIECVVIIEIIVGFRVNGIFWVKIVQVDFQFEGCCLICQQFVIVDDDGVCIVCVVSQVQVQFWVDVGWFVVGYGDDGKY